MKRPLRPTATINPPSFDADKFLSTAPLNEYQKAFCKEPSRKVRLLAPAGNGKTHSLLWRCLTQMQMHRETESHRFLIFTFTKAAKDELLERLNKEPLFAELRNSVEISTLNSWGNRRVKLRLQSPRLITEKHELYFCMQNTLQPFWMKYPRIKAAMTSSKKKSSVAKDLMELMDAFKALGYRHDLHKQKEGFLAHSEWLIENGMNASIYEVLEKLRKYEIIANDCERPKSFEEIFKNYFGFWRESTEWLYKSSVITLEDQKYWALVDVEKAVNEGRFTSGIHRFQHILVDEFQDINVLDLELLKAIAKSNKTSLCVIGDDDQAIYEWRGATPEFLLSPDDHIEEDYQTHILGRNYRSPKNIVALSQKLIRHNNNRVEKEIEAHLKNDAEIIVERATTLNDSIRFVTDMVKELLADKDINKIALIGRKRSQIIPYQIVFASDEIPFCAAEDLQIFLSKAFNDLQELITLKTQADTPLPRGPEPVQALLKFCNKVPRFSLKKDHYVKLRSYLTSKRPRTISQALDYLYEYTGPLMYENNDGSYSASFYEAIKEFLDARTVAGAIQAASEHFKGLQKDYGKSLDDIFYLDPPFLYLSEFAERYGDDYDRFYEDVENAISTLAQTPSDDDSIDNAWQRRLHLMTALRAKGKEFDAVIILDCNQNIFPNRFAETEEKLEAERRLFYVAFTRAKKKVVFVVNEIMFGQIVRPTQFLTEMGLI
jgi:DNA helicase-2/ATP-dependent DNA helicase PcrA